MERLAARLQGPKLIIRGAVLLAKDVSPQPINQSLVRHQLQIFGGGLSNQQPVGRFLASDVHLAGGSSVMNGDCRPVEALLGNDAFKVLRQQCGIGQLADVELGSDFRIRRSADATPRAV